MAMERKANKTNKKQILVFTTQRSLLCMIEHVAGTHC